MLPFRCVVMIFGGVTFFFFVGDETWGNRDLFVVVGHCFFEIHVNDYLNRAESDQIKPIKSPGCVKRLLTNMYYPRTEVRKMEDELYNLTVKGNDLKPYVTRFQELAVLCPNMVPNTEKLLEAFIGGLPRSIEGNVTASKPQTLEEAINIAKANGSA
ncbi:reverse transcriptase domain-containing protein [Tanacetum coccineum]